jgi:hypothetical protein
MLKVRFSISAAKKLRLWKMFQNPFKMRSWFIVHNHANKLLNFYFAYCIHFYGFAF